MGKKISLILVLFLILMTVSGGVLFAEGQKEKGEDKTVVAFSIMDYSIDFLMELLASSRKTAEELGIELRDYNSQFDTVKQVNNIEDAIAQRVDCILVHPVESSAVVPGILAANDAGIPVVAVDIKPTDGKLECFVASDNTNIGRLAAKEVVKNLEKKYGEARGDIVICGNDMVSSMRLRKVGVLEVFGEYNGIKILDMHDFATKLPTAIEVSENILQKYGEGKLDFILTLNSTQTIGANTVISSANRKDVSVMGIDKDVDILNAIKDPNSTLIGTVVQSPADMGRISIEQCLKAVKGEAIDQDFFEAPVKVINKENVNEYLSEAIKMNEELEPYKIK